jgi:transposase
MGVPLPRSHPSELRRKALDLIEEGRPVRKVAAQLGIGERTVYTWRQQDQIDRGRMPGVSSADRAALAATREHVTELENELAFLRRAAEVFDDAS